jgi:hypothetical protein
MGRDHVLKLYGTAGDKSAWVPTPTIPGERKGSVWMASREKLQRMGQNVNHGL